MLPDSTAVSFKDVEGKSLILYDSQAEVVLPVIIIICHSDLK